jgi:hypothetical protein
MSPIWKKMVYGGTLAYSRMRMLAHMILAETLSFHMNYFWLAKN